MIRNSKSILAVTGLFLCLGLAQFVMAQSGTRNSPQQQQNQNTQGSAPRNEAPFDDRFWGFLKQAQYQNWASLPGIPSDGYPGNSPHGKHVKLYVNRTAAADQNAFQSGSILVKENYDESGKTLMAVTVMYRSKGFAPDAGDWYWAKYESNGRVSTMNNMRISGRVGMCIDCHQSAQGDDFVFANDN
ncbi:cytochrome P460 family protein [Rubinisphaera italica]|uniref:Cytochrome P460 domain-containing protein n=1 Tax=Rubinisphaera italica TaxID=2527969 RepID=A0A5C5XLG0_9PLAN|nr:cytochrome P460 family protein [Rubinisphaera italica]TWT64027.1 hypothetical protein Pan54_47870 [Rubinisphaera italica]